VIGPLVYIVVAIPTIIVATLLTIELLVDVGPASHVLYIATFVLPGALVGFIVFMGTAAWMRHCGLRRPGCRGHLRVAPGLYAIMLYLMIHAWAHREDSLYWLFDGPTFALLALVGGIAGDLWGGRARRSATPAIEQGQRYPERP
jgi:hypothetical protein